MEKSFNSSEVDIEASSIFNRYSNPSSPFIRYSQFTASNPVKKHFRVHKPTRNFGLDQIFPPEGLGSDRLTAAPYHNYEVSQVDMMSNDGSIVSACREERRRQDAQPQTPTRKRVAEFSVSKVETMESIMSTAISTKNMVLVKPKIMSCIENLNAQEVTNAQDHSDKSVTTLFLKSFNIVSRIFNSNLEQREASENPHSFISRAKRIKKTLVSSFIDKAGSQLNDGLEPNETCCNCKNSSCIKLYCECFRLNGTCGSSCKCVNCKNTRENPDRTAMVRLMSKKAADLEPLPSQLVVRSDLEITRRGCNCKKSKCSKKYCACYSQGAFCNSGCCCVNCLNAKKQ